MKYLLILILALGCTSTGLTARVHGLPIKPSWSKTGYTRAAFGPAWLDVDHNHCDTRNDILNRDLTDKTWLDAKHCVVATGMLSDPYLGLQVAFNKDKATTVQIDHVVALENAWTTGAAGWSLAQKEQFANDPANLLAVDGSSNESKGDADASVWVPPNKKYDCIYVQKQISVKIKYHLWATKAENAAMKAILASC